MKALFWVQHLLGIGHVRRAQALASALTDAGVSVTVAQGGFDVPGTEFAGAEIMRLPPIKAADERFSGLIDADGQPVGDALRAERTAKLLALFDELQPDILITETFPFGRRALRSEVIPLLEAASKRRPRPTIVASVRDVLVAKHQEKKERWMADTARRFYDRIIIHGDRSLIPFAQTFPFAEQIDNLLFYSGYIAPGRKSAEQTHTGRDIIVSGGGGAVSADMFNKVLQAIRPSGLSGERWRFLVGPEMPTEFRRHLVSQVSGLHMNVQIEPTVPDLTACLATARLSISQAGYNTVMDILTSGVRSIVIPFAADGESEQAIRATVLADHGRLAVVNANADPSTLATAMRAAINGPTPKPLDLLTNGAENAAEAIVSLAQMAHQA